MVVQKDMGYPVSQQFDRTTVNLFEGVRIHVAAVVVEQVAVDAGHVPV